MGAFVTRGCLARNLEESTKVKALANPDFR